MKNKALKINRSKAQINETNIIDLVRSQSWDSLNNVEICCNVDGEATALFGQHRWDLLPYSRSKAKRYINFNFLEKSPELQLEIKLLTFGWLNHKSMNVNHVKFSTIEQRVYKISAAYRYLKKVNAKSLSHLSHPNHFEEFKSELEKQNYSQRSIQLIFVAINKAIELEPWLNFSFGFSTKFEGVSISKNISNRDVQQTMVIPERLADFIYGKAIKLVEDALPHKSLIAETEIRIQQNYTLAKIELDKKIKLGNHLVFVNTKGEVINNRKYLTGIADNLPYEVGEITEPLSNLINDIEIKNGRDFRRYYGQLITACYIVCGAFSGMRDSELDKLTPNSYYKESLKDRDFHMLQSGTFKLGERKETWVTAPIVEKAIELAAELTEAWRKQIEYPNSKFTNTLWCNQVSRSTHPKLIADWPARLKRFCRHFDCLVTKDDYQECIQSNPNSINKIKSCVFVGKPWPLAPHQFRRTLAYYTIKHKLGTKIALKQQFKHLRLSMTEWYTNGGQLASLLELSVDKRVQQTLEAANAEMIANKIFKQWHTSEPLSGTFGKSIVKMRNDIPYIYSSWKTIYEAVQNGLLTLHGTAHSYCKNGYDCDMDGVVMPQFCVDCSSNGSIITEEQAEWWQKKHNTLTNYLTLERDASVTEKSHFITQIRAAESVMNDFNMPFEPFEPDLRIKSV